MEKRQNLVNTAKSYLGCSESDGSHKKIIDLYNSISPLPRGYKMSYSDPWCAAFVSAVGKDFGLLPECSCDAMIALYKAKGQYYGPEHQAQPGDLIFYDWDSNLSADHVGIVCEVTGNVMKVIEGNVSDKVAYRVLTAGSSYIKGYAIAFPLVGGGAFDAPPVGAGIARPQTVNLEIPQLSPGNTGSSVKAMQHLLIGNGYSCGSCGADGDFGPATRIALCAYQRERGLSPDAIAGKQTWSAMLL